MNIAVDLDGVLWDLMQELCRVHNAVNDDNKKVTDIDDWSFFDKWHITEKEFVSMLNIIKLKDVPIIDSKAHKYLKKLQKYGTVDILTARREETRGEVIDKLESMKIYEGKHYESLIIVPYHPYDVKINYQYDVYIDDSPRLADTIKVYNLEENERKFLFLWNQPWNWKIESSQRVKRVNGWKDIINGMIKYFTLPTFIY